MKDLFNDKFRNKFDSKLNETFDNKFSNKYEDKFNDKLQKDMERFADKLVDLERDRINLYREKLDMMMAPPLPILRPAPLPDPETVRLWNDHIRNYMELQNRFVT